MSEVKLKPCPFCGGDAGVFQWTVTTTAHVRCKSCSVQQNDYVSKEIAVAAWNNRPLETTLETKNAELKAKIAKLDSVYALAERYTNSEAAALIRELSRENDELTVENKALEAEIERLKSDPANRIDLTVRMQSPNDLNRAASERIKRLIDENAELKERLEQLTNPPREVCEACGEATWDEEPKGWQVAHTPYDGEIWFCPKCAVKGENDA